MSGTEADTALKGCVATVGTFDGVHRGHRLVIDTLLGEARAEGLPPVVLTFRNHPLTLIAPDRAPGRIMQPEEEKAVLDSLGVGVVMLDFTPELRTLTAGRWMERLRDEYGVKTLVMGFDNTFGCDGLSLSLDDYRRLGENCGIKVIVAPRLPGVSSSAIRRMLAGGDVKGAAAALGRPFTLAGEVVHGKELGRRLGFPTANVRIPEGGLVPATGVYAAEAVMPDGKLFPAVVNVGRRPTVDDGDEISVEAHIVGWKGDIYGRALLLRLTGRLRGEKRFGSLDELKAAISADVEAVRDSAY